MDTDRDDLEVLVLHPYQPISLLQKVIYLYLTCEYFASLESRKSSVGEVNQKVWLRENECGTQGCLFGHMISKYPANVLMVPVRTYENKATYWYPFLDRYILELKGEEREKVVMWSRPINAVHEYFEDFFTIGEATEIFLLNANRNPMPKAIAAQALRVLERKFAVFKMMEAV